MTTGRRDLPRTRKKPASPYPEVGLAELGLRAGDAVRFRRADDTRWKQATVERREKDGSLGLRDSKGAARAIPIEQIEVRTTTRRGALTWEPLTERANRDEQLRLL